MLARGQEMHDHTEGTKCEVLGPLLLFQCTVSHSALLFSLHCLYTHSRANENKPDGKRKSFWCKHFLRKCNFSSYLLFEKKKCICKEHRNVFVEQVVMSSRNVGESQATCNIKVQVSSITLREKCVTTLQLLIIYQSNKVT